MKSKQLCIGLFGVLNCIVNDTPLFHTENMNIRRQTCLCIEVVLFYQAYSQSCELKKRQTV